jgi:hypothetical protein
MRAALPAGRGGAGENHRDLLNLVKLARGDLHDQGDRFAYSVADFGGFRGEFPS